jgi:hypothetical protein
MRDLAQGVGDRHTCLHIRDFANFGAGKSRRELIRTAVGLADAGKAVPRVPHRTIPSRTFQPAPYGLADYEVPHHQYFFSSTMEGNEVAAKSLPFVSRLRNDLA